MPDCSEAFFNGGSISYNKKDRYRRKLCHLRTDNIKKVFLIEFLPYFENSCKYFGLNTLGALTAKTNEY